MRLFCVSLCLQDIHILRGWLNFFAIISKSSLIW